MVPLMDTIFIEERVHKLDFDALVIGGGIAGAAPGSGANCPAPPLPPILKPLFQATLWARPGSLSG